MYLNCPMSKHGYPFNIGQNGVGALHLIKLLVTYLLQTPRFRIRINTKIYNAYYIDN
jgi:hypothetical protein